MPAERKNKGKTRYDLINLDIEDEVARVFTFGSRKYSDRNWEKGMPISVHYASCRRHMLAFMAGEDYDKESGLHHLAHAIWNLGAMIWTSIMHPQLDDRKKMFKGLFNDRPRDNSRNL